MALVSAGWVLNRFIYPKGKCNITSKCRAIVIDVVTFPEGSFSSLKTNTTSSRSFCWLRDSIFPLFHMAKSSSPLKLCLKLFLSWFLIQFMGKAGCYLWWRFSCLGQWHHPNPEKIHIKIFQSFSKLQFLPFYFLLQSGHLLSLWLRNSYTWIKSNLVFIHYTSPSASGQLNRSVGFALYLVSALLSVRGSPPSPRGAKCPLLALLACQF